ncbi:HHEX protein, partial [Mesembrinibis cayennensis]|nr:HHEX protein [Mesembrinibis cayennensis]
VHPAFSHHLAATYGTGAYTGPLYSFPRAVGDYAHALIRQDPLGKPCPPACRRAAPIPSPSHYPVLSLVFVAQVKTWFQNRRAKWRRLKQENPQATKKEEVEGADSHSDQRLESCPTPEQKGKEVSLDGSQYTPSPASQEDLESDVSDDSDQEVDIEGDKGYYNPTH